jgi:hypothetical protein
LKVFSKKEHQTSIFQKLKAKPSIWNQVKNSDVFTRQNFKQILESLFFKKKTPSEMDKLGFICSLTNRQKRKKQH